MSTPDPDDEWARRARSFGAAARQYDRSRPTYVAQLVDDVVAELPGRDVVEVGAGTGKATRLFAARDLELTCVEPDAEMAAVLAENCRDFPNVSIVAASFEDWETDARFDGLIAAQSWHWTDPDRRWIKAAELVREGGVLALFWNHTRWHLSPLAREIDRVYDRHGLRRQQLNSEPEAKARPAWPANELSVLATFTDVEARSYESTQTYTAAEWCGYLASTSDHLLAEPQVNEAVLAGVRRVIARSGDALEIRRRCDLYLARRTSARAAARS